MVAGLIHINSELLNRELYTWRTEQYRLVAGMEVMLVENVASGLTRASHEAMAGVDEAVYKKDLTP